MSRPPLLQCDRVPEWSDSTLISDDHICLFHQRYGEERIVFNMKLGVFNSQMTLLNMSLLFKSMIWGFILISGVLSDFKTSKTQQPQHPASVYQSPTVHYFLITSGSKWTWPKTSPSFATSAPNHSRFCSKMTYDGLEIQIQPKSL